MTPRDTAEEFAIDIQLVRTIRHVLNSEMPDPNILY